MSAEQEPRVRSVGELPQHVAPARDLWPGIEARLHETSAEEAKPTSRPVRWGLPVAVGSLAAALVLGVWIGRGFAPGPAGPTLSAHPMAAGLELLDATYLPDAQYRQQRDALLASLDSRLAGLPPETQQKVKADLATIHDSMRDIQSALGRAPGDALLGELLINLYHDEMRVLTSVHDTRAARAET